MAVAVAFEAEKAGRLERLSPPSAELVAAWTLGSHQAPATESSERRCGIATKASTGHGPPRDMRSTKRLSLAWIVSVDTAGPQSQDAREGSDGE